MPNKSAGNTTTRRHFIVATGLGLLSSGCAGGQGTDGPLTMLTHYGNDPLKSGLQKLVDEWNRTHPDNKIRTQAVKYDDLLQTITVRQTGGKAPDIVQAYSLWGGQLNRVRLLAEPPDDIAKDIRANFSKSAVDSVTHEGRVLGYPTEVQTYALFYNKKYVEKPPTTWAELESAAERATKRDAKGNLEVEGFGLMNGWDSAVVHPFVALLQAAGGTYISNDRKHATFDSDAGRQALELEKRLIDKNVTDPGINVLQGFPSEKVAMAINSGWWIGALKQSMKDRYENVGVVPVPGPEKGMKGSLAYGFFMGVNAKSRKQEAAWRFLKWLNAEKSRQSGATRMGTFQFSLGTIPGRPADSKALEGTIDDPNYKPFIDALEYALPEPNVRNGQLMKTTLQRSIESVWAGEKPVDEALAAARQKADDALAGE